MCIIMRYAIAVQNVFNVLTACIKAHLCVKNTENIFFIKNFI